MAEKPNNSEPFEVKCIDIFFLSEKICDKVPKNEDFNMVDFWSSMAIIIGNIDEEKIGVFLINSDGSSKLSEIKDVFTTNIKYAARFTLKDDIGEYLQGTVCELASRITKCCDKQNCALIIISNQLNMIEDFYSDKKDDGYCYLAKNFHETYLYMSKNQVRWKKEKIYDFTSLIMK